MAFLSNPLVCELLEYTLSVPLSQQHVWSRYHKSFYEYEYQMVESIYGLQPDYLEKFCETELWLYKKEAVDLLKSRKLLRDTSSEVKQFYCFLTINYNDQTNIDIKIMHRIAQQILGQKNVLTAKYVHEKHRKEEGIHHHTHFLITTEKYISAGDMIDPIFKISAIKNYVGSRNFIDCVVAHARKNNAHAYADYEKYINGDKKEEKMKYIILDRAWRIETGYEHQYEYKK